MKAACCITLGMDCLPASHPFYIHSFNLTQPATTLAYQALHFSTIFMNYELCARHWARSFPHEVYCHSTSSFSPRLRGTIRFYLILSPALDRWAYLFKGIIINILLLSSFLSTSALTISNPHSLLNLLYICEV